MIYATLLEHSSESQTQWGNQTPTEGNLEIGKRYEVAEIEVHSSHTKVHLKDFPGKTFNSVVFAFDPADAWDDAASQWRKARGYSR